MNHPARRGISLLVGLVALGVGVRGALAQGPPQLSKLTIVGQSADRVVAAGAPLKVRLGGVGRCPVEIQIQAVGGATVHTQTFDAALGGNDEYGTAYHLPPYGTAGRAPLTGDFIVTARPLSPCKGSAQAAKINTICRGTCASYGAGARERATPERPRIVIPSLPLRPTASAPAPGPAPAPTPNATGTSSSKASAPPSPPAPSIPNGGKPATGSVSSLLVPGGSFAEDEAQKIQVKGTGGCALDLRISNKSYGGGFDKTFAVNPVNLASAPTLYNGTHFDTLGEGSYHADATGKSGCSGTAGIDFKVTSKTSTAHVKGQPTLTLDKQPKSGDTFLRTKDSNVWFKVSVPSSFKDVPYVSCCEVEYDYINQYGGWEVLPTSPFTDGGLNPMANNNQASFRSISYFTVPNEVATRWRMRVRGTKYKTTFDWSDWLEFKVDQN